MLPSVDTENGLDVDSAGGQALLVGGVRAHSASKLVAQGSVGRVGGHVDRLAAGVRGRVGRAGVVGAEDVHQAFPLKVLSQPHESRSEHGVGGGQEVELQGFDRGAGVDDVFGELVRDLGLRGGLSRRSQN